MSVRMMSGAGDFNPVSSGGSTAGAQPFAAVAAVHDPLAPFLVVQVPLNGFPQAGLEGLGRFPTQLGLDLRGVDGVTLIMPGAVVDEGDQLPVWSMTRVGAQFVQQIAERVDDIQVGFFVVAAVTC